MTVAPTSGLPRIESSTTPTSAANPGEGGALMPLPWADAADHAQSVAAAAAVSLRLVKRRPLLTVRQVQNDIPDVLRDPRIVRVVDVLRFIGDLVVIRVEAGEEERDRDVEPRIVRVVAAPVDVVVPRPRRRGIEAIVQPEW